jgi:hypothetical protein
MATQNDSTPTAPPWGNKPAQSVANRLYAISASVDGAASILQGIVDNQDREVSRQSFACADLLERLSDDLDKIAEEVAALEKERAS